MRSRLPLSCGVGCWLRLASIRPGCGRRGIFCADGSIWCASEPSCLLAHVQNTHHQYNLPGPAGKIIYASHRDGVAERFSDLSARKSVEVDLALVAHYGEVGRELELYLAAQAKEHDANAYYRLRSIPGVGKILTLAILYEIHQIQRFPRVREFPSYARLVKCERSSAGKTQGTGGSKIGNVHLKWAFSEAAVGFLRKNPRGQRYLGRLARKHGKSKALSILAAKLGRTTYYMLTRKTAFEMERFLMV
jgi:transposase